MSKENHNREKDIQRKNLQFSPVDLTYIDTELVRFFQNLEIQIHSEFDNKLEPLNVIISTPEAWKLLREGKDSNIGGTTNPTTKRTVFPVLAIKRGDIEKDPEKNRYEINEVRLANRWSRRNQFSNKNVDKYLNKDWNPKREIITVRVPLFVNIKYEIAILARKNSQINTLIESLLSIDRIFILHTAKMRLILNFDDNFANSSNIDDYSDQQRLFETTLGLTIATQLIPAFDYAKRPWFRKYPTVTRVIYEEKIV